MTTKRAGITVNQIINMIMRIVMHKGMNMGTNKGIDHIYSNKDTVPNLHKAKQTQKKCVRSL